MKIFSFSSVFFLLTSLVSNLSANEKALPPEIQKIMQQPKYAHAIWGLYVKDLETGTVLYDLNSEKLFSPASTTKIFTVEALINTYGDDYRFKTPVYIDGVVKDERLVGNLILVGQGDLTMGGRQSNPNQISYTKMDHITANEVPGTVLTKEDPLNGINALAKDVYEKGIKEVEGDVIIDDSLFETTEKRGMIISPMMINENLIDLVINPTTSGQKAKLTWRPEIPGYHVDNQVQTVDKNGSLELEVTSSDSGKNIVIKGTIPLDQHDIVRTSAIENPKAFAREAFLQALEKQGIKISVSSNSAKDLPQDFYQKHQPIAVWVSPPLSEYGKLILKVSHNLGANLVPMLLAAHQKMKTFDEGMKLMGDFVSQKVKVSPNAFVFIDGAGGNENRLTPNAEVQLLEFVHNQTPEKFKYFYDSLPILGVDGSLEEFGKNTAAAGKVRAKPGTGVAYNVATGKLFLITQAYAGYIEGKNGHLLAYMLAVNNGELPTIDDIFPIFEDEALISNIIFEQSSSN